MVKDRWPLPYSGAPAVLSGLSMVCFTVGLLVSLAKVGDLSLVVIVASGIAMGLLSTGKEVRVSRGEVVLEYGFPKPVLRYRVEDVVEVLDVSELSRGKLVKYFKYLLVPFVVIVAIPPAYLVVKGVYPHPALYPLILLPVFMGVLLQLYIMFTAETYRKMIRRFSLVFGATLAVTVFIAGLVYREAYGRSIVTDPHSLTLCLLGMLLLALATIAFATLTKRGHVVVVESSDGKFYAVGTASSEAAKEFIEEVLRKVVAGAEATA